MFTGDERGAGTDSNIFLTIIGELGETSEKPLDKSETHFNKFERNKVKFLFMTGWPKRFSGSTWIFST